jgi:AraC-like DNA-binding protein
MELVPGYREMPPPEALRGVVDCLWVRVTGTADDVRVLPDGCTDVVWRQGHGATVAGPDTTAKLFGYSETELLVGIRFLPGAGGGVLGVPLDEVRDLHVDVVDVDRAFDIDADLAPADVLAGFLSAAADRQGDPIVAEAVRRLARQDVRDVARDLAISERQLLRRFRAAVGYGPKTLARVMRFRRFVEAVDAGQGDLASLALDAGYADQAHLTREATRLAGVTPLAFARARRRD